MADELLERMLEDESELSFTQLNTPMSQNPSKKPVTVSLVLVSLLISGVQPAPQSQKSIRFVKGVTVGSTRACLFLQKLCMRPLQRFQFTCLCTYQCTAPPLPGICTIDSTIVILWFTPLDKLYSQCLNALAISGNVGNVYLYGILYLCNFRGLSFANSQAATDFSI